jgi:hypothetical protein
MGLRKEAEERLTERVSNIEILWICIGRGYKETYRKLLINKRWER